MMARVRTAVLSLALPYSCAVAFTCCKKPTAIPTAAERWPRQVAADSYAEPDESSNFGRKQYWDECYRQSSASEDAMEGSNRDSFGSPEPEEGQLFSWYCGWQDLEPFFSELVPDRTSRLLVPGIGNDATIRDMFDSGFRHMSAFDYAPEGVELARRMFGDGRLIGCEEGSSVDSVDSSMGEGVDLRVADARDLPYSENSFDAVLEKGTLDAVYLSGGTDKDRARLHLSKAVSELARVVRPGGVVFSVTAACVDAIQDAFDQSEGAIWTQVRDGSPYITEDGFASNNIDATMLIWLRK